MFYFGQNADAWGNEVVKVSPDRKVEDLCNRRADGDIPANTKRARIIAPTISRAELHDMRNAGEISNRDMYFGQGYASLANDLDVEGIAERKMSQLQLARARGCIIDKSH